MKFLINRDKSEVFNIGFLNDTDSHKSMDSIVLVYKNKTFTKSTAVLKSMCLLGGVYQLARIFYCIPKIIRDYIYSTIASHRYKWFGKLDQCPTLPEEWKKRMIN
jgi:predicted DCC family thiol-disulfide oxidoreductase YuxK